MSFRKLAGCVCTIQGQTFCVGKVASSTNLPRASQPRSYALIIRNSITVVVDFITDYWAGPTRLISLIKTLMN